MQGNVGDQPVLKLAWNGSYKYTLNFVSGDLEILSPGRGIRLTSPDGLTTKTLRLNNAGAVELI